MKPNHHPISRNYWQSAHRFAAAAILATAISLPSMTEIVRAQTVTVFNVDVKAVAEGYRASKLTGRPVDNSKGQKIGHIDDFIINRDKVLFAILQVGGFLGVGGYLVAVPYDALQINPSGTKIVLTQGTKADLKNMPQFKYDQK